MDVLHIAAKNGFPVKVVSELLNEEPLSNIARAIKSLIATRNSDISFSLPKFLVEQYLHSDCYVLAEFMVFMMGFRGF